MLQRQRTTGYLPPKLVCTGSDLIQSHTGKFGSLRHHQSIPVEGKQCTIGDNKSSAAVRLADFLRITTLTPCSNWKVNTVNTVNAADAA